MRKFKKLFVIALLAIIALPIIISYSDYRFARVNNDDSELFTQQLQAAVQKGKPFDLKEVATFEWDEMYVFEPYRSREEMENAVGEEWHAETSYLGYLINDTSVGDYPLVSEAVQKLVFVHEDEVVLDVTLDRAIADFTSSSNWIHRSDSNYMILRTEGSSTILRNALKE